MFGSGGTESWFTSLNGFLKGYADYGLQPFQKGVAQGIDTIVRNTWGIAAANPYATVATVIVGGVTLYAYKSGGFGANLGKLHVGFNSFLAHATVKVGLGKEPEVSLWGVSQRLDRIDNTLRRLEEGQDALRQDELARYRTTQTRLGEIKDSVAGLGTEVGRQLTSLFTLHKATGESVTAIGLAGTETNQAVRRLEEGVAAANAGSAPADAAIRWKAKQ